MSDENPTAAELLQAVNAAILELLQDGVKTSTINGRSYTRNEIPELRALRAELVRECRSTSSIIRLGDVSA